MLLPIRKRNGLVYRTLICDTCRKPIDECDFPAATADFNPIQAKDLQAADYDVLLQHAVERHFHAGCAPQHCTSACWQKVDRTIPAMVANLFNAKGSTIGKAAEAVRKEQGPDEAFPFV